MSTSQMSTSREMSNFSDVMSSSINCRFETLIRRQKNRGRFWRQRHPIQPVGNMLVTPISEPSVYSWAELCDAHFHSNDKEPSRVAAWSRAALRELASARAGAPCLGSENGALQAQLVHLGFERSGDDALLLQPQRLAELELGMSKARTRFHADAEQRRYGAFARLLAEMGSAAAAAAGGDLESGGGAAALVCETFEEAQQQHLSLQGFVAAHLSHAGPFLAGLRSVLVRQLGSPSTSVGWELSDAELVETEFTEPAVKLLLQALRFVPSCGGGARRAGGGGAERVWVVDERMSDARAKSLVRLLPGASLPSSGRPCETERARRNAGGDLDSGYSHTLSLGDMLWSACVVL